jgi:hypothetical protein
MRKYFFTLLFCYLCTQSFGADTTKVLFIGNSFVASNNLPELFRGLTELAGHSTVVMGHAPGGIFVGDTRQGSAAHAYNPMTYDLIRSNKWDFVVIQDNQGFYSYNVGQFPPYSKVVEGHAQIRDSVIANNPCAKVLLFSGWCFKNGWQGGPPTFATGSEMNQRVYENYVYINKTLKEIVCPISISWNRIIKALPAIDLWDMDEAHPSAAGSYLAAVTIYCSIFKDNPELVQYNGSVDPVSAQTMRKTAFEVVRDSAVPTMLAKNMLLVKQVGMMLDADTGCVKYEWYKDGQLAGTTTTPKYGPVAVNDCYTVTGTTAGGCVRKSFKYCAVNNPGGTGVTDVGDAVAAIYPNPAHGVFHIKLRQPAGEVKVELCDVAGRSVYSKTFAGSTDLLSVAYGDVVSGVYMVKIQNQNSTSVQRIYLSK